MLGVSFLVLHTQGRLPASFALTAGWGDIAIGVTAPLVAWLIATRGTQARRPLLMWNTLGLLDLIVAVTLGIVSSPALQGGFTGAESPRAPCPATVTNDASHAGDAVKTKTLCAILDLEKSTLSRNIALMVGKGWIESQRALPPQAVGTLRLVSRPGAPAVRSTIFG